MSSILDADEVCMLAHNPYDAGQRALWHLEKIGSIVDCMHSKSSPSFGNDLSLVYAVPKIIKTMSDAHFLPHSTSVEEFGMFGDSLSPRAITPVSKPRQSSSVRFLRITDKTRVKFLNPNSVAVFSLDLSPSMNVIDTSFKSISTGCHLVENLVNTLSLSFRCLLNRTRISGGSEDLPFPCQPNLFVTVIAHGIPESGVVPLVVGELLTAEKLDEILERISARVHEAIDKLSTWLIANHSAEQMNGAISCSRTRTPCTSLVCTANDVSTVVRDGLTAISMTCSQLGLSKAGVNKSLMVVTDGVLAHPRKLPYDNILMHLNFVDVAMHIVQVGGGFAPWSALGYSSDPDLLRLLAASTPTGLFLQDHHLDPILSGSVQPEGRGIYGPTPHLVANVLAKALLLKFSSLTTNLRRKRSHMPFRSLSYQSSLLVNNGAGDASNSYIDHIQSSRMSRSHETVLIQGIADVDPPQRSLSSSMGFSPISRKRVTSVDSMATSFGDLGDDGLESDFSSEETSTAGQSTSAIQSLKSYLEPEKTKAARPYLYKQYKLPGVSVAQIIQTRAREGFLIEATTSGGSRRLSTSTSSPQLKRTNSSLIRTGSNSSLVTSVSEPKRSELSVSLSMNWGPTMDIIYEITTTSTVGDESSTTPGESFISRPSEEVRIKIYLRMQSGDFFLRFKQQLSTSANHDTYFGQMCKQLDAFIDSIFQVDDVLAKIINRYRKPPTADLRGIRRQQSQEIASRVHSLNKISEESVTIAQSHSMESLISDIAPSPPYTPRDVTSQLKEIIPKNVAHWHRWFTVRNLFILNEMEVSKGRIRHGMLAQSLVAGRELVIQSIREFSHEEFDSGSKFLINVNKLGGIELLMTNSHVSNILCRSNDVLVSRLLGDSRGGTVTDTINPFVVIDVATTIVNETPHGVVVLTLGLFGMCPSMESKFVDILSNRIGDRSVLLDAPSPIFRSIAAGLLRTGLHAKKQPVARTNTVVVPTTTVGMGSGESFYTYSPEPSLVNKFMIYYAWETVCPSATVMTDLLSKIHEERTKDGWKCIHESQNGLTYVEFTDRENLAQVKVSSTPSAGELTRLWVPSSSEWNVKEPRASSTKSTSSSLDVDWSGAEDDKKQVPEICSRKSIKGMCICLHVQYIQPRAEKPNLKCQIWIDRGHPEWRSTGIDDLKKFAHNLCGFEQD